MLRAFAWLSSSWQPIPILVLYLRGHNCSMCDHARSTTGSYFLYAQEKGEAMIRACLRADAKAAFRQVMILLASILMLSRKDCLSWPLGRLGWAPPDRNWSGLQSPLQGGQEAPMPSEGGLKQCCRHPYPYPIGLGQGRLQVPSALHWKDC